MKILLFLFASSLWAQVPIPGLGGSGGGGGSSGCNPAGSANHVLVDDGAGGCTTANGVTIVGNLVSASNGFSSGATPPTCTAGTAGVVCLKEGTAATGEADAAIIYSKTDHLLYAKLNNAAETAICTIASGCGGSPPVDSTTAGNGLYYLFGACVDCTSAALVANANQGHGAQFVSAATWTSRYAQVTIGATASGTGCSGGTCGLIMGIYSADTSTAVCVSEVGTSGNATARKNINVTFAQLALAWSTGSAVSAGVCTLPAGVYWFFYSSDSTTLSGLGMATAFALEARNAVNVKWAFQNSMTTGNGASIAFVSGPFTLVTQTGTGVKLSQIILEN